MKNFIKTRSKKVSSFLFIYNIDLYKYINTIKRKIKYVKKIEDKFSTITAWYLVTSCLIIDTESIGIYYKKIFWITTLCLIALVGLLNLIIKIRKKYKNSD